MAKNKNGITIYEKSAIVRAYQSKDLLVEIVDIIHTECEFVIYKWKNYENIWEYSGRKLSELMYWNSLMDGLNEKDREKLFKMNGLDYHKCLGR